MMYQHQHQHHTTFMSYAQTPITKMLQNEKVNPTHSPTHPKQGNHALTLTAVAPPPCPASPGLSGSSSICLTRKLFSSKN